MTRREHETVALVFDLRPQHSGRVGDCHARADVETLLRLGHCGFIADRGNAALHQGVHQRGFADVWNAHDHHAQRLDVVVAMWCDRLAVPGHARDVGWLLAGQRDRRDAILPVVKIQPGLGRRGIGQVGLVEDL